MKKAYYPKANHEVKIDANLLGPCGYYCGFCLAYKNGVCLGCRYQAERSETKGIVPVFCDVLACATKKGFERCADCAEYPCDRIDIFSKVFVDYQKEARNR
jgi:predicted amidophosphoribosyltransferase